MRKLFVLLLVATSAVLANASTFDYNFNSGVMPSGLYFQGSPGYTISFNSGMALLAKQNFYGSGPGAGTLHLAAWGIGDWTVQTQAVQIDHRWIESGVVATIGQRFEDSTVAHLTHTDTFFVGNQGVDGNIFPYSLQIGGGYAPTSATTVAFKETRVGDTISDYYDAGQGWVLLLRASGPDLLAPTDFGLFTTMEAGYTAYQEVGFNYFTITADSFQYPTPEPTSFLLLTTASIAILRYKRRM